MRKKNETKKDKNPLEEVSPEELSELRDKARERDEYYNKYLSVHAEYENVRRRMEKEKCDNIRFANETLILRLFPIMDNFDMALAAMDKAEDKDSVLEGIKMVQKEFHRVLGDCGVEKTPSVGEKFDPEFHEAFGVEKTEEFADNTVVKEIRSGYKLNDRLIRPAQVIVAQNTGSESDPDQGE